MWAHIPGKVTRSCLCSGASQQSLPTENVRAAKLSIQLEERATRISNNDYGRSLAWRCHHRNLFRNWLCCAVLWDHSRREIDDCYTFAAPRYASFKNLLRMKNHFGTGTTDGIWLQQLYL
jgi:hypothetical protein